MKEVRAGDEKRAEEEMISPVAPNISCLISRYDCWGRCRKRREWLKGLLVSDVVWEYCKISVFFHHAPVFRLVKILSLLFCLSNQWCSLYSLSWLARLHCQSVYKIGLWIIFSWRGLCSQSANRYQRAFLFKHRFSRLVYRPLAKSGCLRGRDGAPAHT